MDNKTIIYIANVRLPTEKAHGIQIVKTCEALTKRGCLVTLCIPNRENKIDADIFDFYQIKNPFLVVMLSCYDAISKWPIFKKLAFWIESFTFARSVKKFAGTSSVIYTRDLSAILFLNKNQTIIYEAHTMPKRVGFVYKLLLKKVSKVVAISHGLAAEFDTLGFQKNAIRVVPDAVDIHQFQVALSKAECRQTLSLPENQKIIVYTGHLYSWKGADRLAESAEFLSPDTHVYLVGGTDDDIKQFRKTYTSPNVHVIGWQPHENMPLWLRAADVLIIPNSAKDITASVYTSPLKAYEYMASGNVVVASSVPSLREAFSAYDRVTFFEPDNARALAVAIAASLQAGTTAPVTPVTGLSWDNRAQNILEFIFQK